MTKVRVVLPGYNPKILNPEMLKPYMSPELELSVDYARIAVDSVRHEFDMALMAPALLNKVIAAEKDNVDAVVINMMGDLALRAQKEAVSIPVVSLAEACCHVAAMMGNTFAIINTTEELTPVQHQMVRSYGLLDRLACIEGVQLDPHADYHSEEVLQGLYASCKDAVKNKGADVLILGSGRLVAYREYLESALAKDRISVTIMEPLPTGIYFAKFLADAKIAQSKKAFPSPQKQALESYEEVLSAERI